jgi:hypothetical protein
VENSDSALGYFLQFRGRIGYISQQLRPSGLCFRKGQTYGSLQHAPQLTHAPLRFFETGNTEVSVLFVFAISVFPACCAITLSPTVPVAKSNADCLGQL